MRASLRRGNTWVLVRLTPCLGPLPCDHRPGATGLLQHLCEDYLSNHSGSIEWVCNHSRNTQLALLRGIIDVGLVYERDQEAIAEDEGWSRSEGCIFHDHFILAGPLSDPAEVSSATSIQDAFKRIHQTRSLFHSRVDSSATMWKEQSVWNQLGVRPWDLRDGEEGWFKTSHLGPAEALVRADQQGAYLLSDRSTLIAQTRDRSISNTTVFFEPTSSHDLLMNSCHAVVSPHPPAERRKAVEAFLAYLKSSRCQTLIAEFGKAETGHPLFAKRADGFARDSLVGGRPVDGRWEEQMQQQQQQLHIARQRRAAAVKL